MSRSKVALVAAAAAVVLAAVASVALAHAAYKSSNPADGSTVASPPGSISAEFTEPLTDSSSMSVFDPCGAQVDHGDSQPNGYNMTVSMSGDKAGTYTVEFKAQSALDSHVTSGSFEFTSSGGGPCPGAEPPPDPGSGGGSGGGNGGGGPGGGSTGGGAAQGSNGSASSGGSDDQVSAAPGGGGGRSNGNARTRGPARGPRPSGGSDEPAAGPVAFQNTGSSQPTGEPAPWDLPVGGVVLAFVLCVMIGAAGGRVYAGIVAPRRR